MTTMITVVRHGESVWNKESKLQGYQDIGLTELGLAQARAIAFRLHQQQIAALYSSDLKRAFTTAQIIGESIGKEPTLKKDLRERNYGIFEGLSRDDLIIRYPDEFAKWQKNPLHYVIPNGDSLATFSTRALTCLNQLVQAHLGEHIIVVTHAGILEVLLKHALEVPMEAPRRFVLLNASISVFQWSTSGCLLKTFGDVCHVEISR